MSRPKRSSSVRLLSDMVLTAGSLAAIAARFTVAEIADLIDDADLKPEPELCRA